MNHMASQNNEDSQLTTNITTQTGILGTQTGKGKWGGKEGNRKGRESRGGRDRAGVMG